MFSARLSDVIMRSVLLCIQSFTERAEQKVLWFMSVWSFPSDSSCTICVCSHQSVLLHRLRLSPLSETHRSTRPERCFTPLVDQTTHNTFIHWYIYFLTRVPGDDSLLRHSHNHPHTHETAIWSNLGFSILPKNIDRTVDPLIRKAVCFTSWVTASPEKRTFSEVFLEKSVLKRQTLKMSV